MYPRAFRALTRGRKHKQWHRRCIIQVRESSSPPRIAVQFLTTEVHSPTNCRRVTKSNIGHHIFTISTAGNGAWLHKRGDFSLFRHDGLYRRSKVTHRASVRMIVFSSGQLGVYTDADDVMPREAASRVAARA